MKKSKFLPVYTWDNTTGRRRANIAAWKGKAGVYLIKEKNILVYIGHSSF